MPIRIWGLTGFSGAGKSTALKYLQDEGYPVCDSDKLAAEVLDPKTSEGKANLKELHGLLGDVSIDPSDGGPNRAYLRGIILENKAQRKKFEDWIFPKIITKFELIKSEWENDENVMGFIEGARLVESGYVASLTGLIVVKAHESSRKKRLIEKRGMTPDEVDALFLAQDPLPAERQADFIWDNSTLPKDLYAQIEVFLMVADPES